MEEKKKRNEERVGVGATLTPGSYSIEGEELLLRVRLNGSPLICLIDGQRRVREIVAAPAAVEAPAVAGGTIAYDSRQAAEKPCSVSEQERRQHEAAAAEIADRFAGLLQRYAGDVRACLHKMAPVLERSNPRLACEHHEGGAAGLKAYLIRELFKRTLREERGFKILLLLSQAIALNGGGQPERLEPMTLDEQVKLLKGFMDFLNVVGQKRIDPRIFQEIHVKFNDAEYSNLSRGGTGFFIKPLYVQEMQEMKSQLITVRNSNYIEQLFINSLRESLDVLYDNTLAYLKALAIVRLYARSNRKERGGDSKIVEQIIRDLIRFRPAWVKSASPAPARTA